MRTPIMSSAQEPPMGPSNAPANRQMAKVRGSRPNQFGREALFRTRFPRAFHEDGAGYCGQDEPMLKNLTLPRGIAERSQALYRTCSTQEECQTPYYDYLRSIRR